MRNRVLLHILTLTALVGTTLFSVSNAQQPPPAPPYKVTPLLKEGVSGDPAKEAIMFKVDWPANVSTGRHTHPGDEYATVLDGVLLTKADGGEWRTIAAGQSYHQNAGVVHETRTGDQPARSVNMLFVEKGKPAVQPVK